MYFPQKDSEQAGVEISGILAPETLMLKRPERAVISIDFRDGLINFGFHRAETDGCKDKSRPNTPVPSVGW
jgi:hypothetical protein